MKKSELKEVIKEEVVKMLNESNNSKVVELIAKEIKDFLSKKGHGVDTQHSSNGDEVLFIRDKLTDFEPISITIKKRF